MEEDPDATSYSSPTQLLWFDMGPSSFTTHLLPQLRCFQGLARLGVLSHQVRDHCYDKAIQLQEESYQLYMQATWLGGLSLWRNHRCFEMVITVS